MINNIKDFFKFAAKTGLYFPAAYSHESKGPSISLLLTHLSAYIAMGSIIYLITVEPLSGTTAAIIYASLMITFYLMRRLTSAKFDLDDKSFSLENNEPIILKEKK